MFFFFKLKFCLNQIIYNLIFHYSNIWALKNKMTQFFCCWFFLLLPQLYLQFVALKQVLVVLSLKFIATKMTFLPKAKYMHHFFFFFAEKVFNNFLGKKIVKQFLFWNAYNILEKCLKKNSNAGNRMSVKMN